MPRSAPPPAAVQTMRWTGAHLELLDQRRLPDEIVYLACHNAEEVAGAIREMVVRGAPAIGCAAAFGYALAARAGDDLERAAALLAASRPTAVNLFWAIARMRATRGDEAAQAEALAIYAEDIAANKALGAHGTALIPEGARIMTHCNAGALATAGHGTALGIVRSAHAAGKRVAVIANETRPYLQGARLTAWEMLQEGIPVTLEADVAAGHLMSHGEVDLVLVGADRIAANGDVANKIGTYTLAVLARRHGLPFYVAAPCSTFDLALADGRAIPIEERPADEVTGFRSERWAPRGVAVRNPAFDVTPAELVSAIVCERGVIERPDRARIGALLG
ncbi:MAG: S-methyl-5-thioribose-1-phosphate isomerase [Betaproteobacteria bacterium]|jgi:methylthioribose-1-phosphate isomerase|nr:S-methyl-5-thioribose-1-phosphate isomerase [Betaproteobacteria bacterium]